MSHVAQPAQPAQPAEPAKPYTGTGGYVGPVQRTQRIPSPAPGGAPLGAPTPGSTPPAPPPGVSPSVSTTPVTAPTGGPGASGVPQAAQGLGLDEGSYNAILEDLKETPEPEEFKTNFATLMQQRQMIAPRTQGGGQPTEEYGRYLSKWVREAVAFASTPADFGGKGYTEGQAKMMAIVEARRRWPDIDPSFWAQSLPGGELSQRELGHVKLADKQAPIEVSPRRAARLDPTKIADILTKKEFKTALEWAEDYKQRVGAAANAVDFVQDVYNREIARSKAAQKKVETAEDKLKTYAAYAKKKAEAVAAGKDPEYTDLATYQKAADQNYAEYGKALDEAKKEADNIGSEEEILTEISNQGEILSVAAALSQLY